MMTAIIATLGRVPWLVWPLVLALAFGGVEHLRAGRLAGEVETVKAEGDARFARLSATYATEAARAADVAASETARRIAAQEEIANDAMQRAAQARSDAATAGDAGERLRKRYAALAASCSRPRAVDPAASAGGEAADTAGDLLASVLDRVAAAAGQLALAADQSRIAGVACEATYDALMRRPTP